MESASLSDIHSFSGALPFLRLTPEIAIPTYFAIISLSFCLCILWLVRRSQRLLMSRNTTLDIALTLMLGGFVGARLLHVFFEAPAYYAENWRRVLEVWHGGFVWYGGALVGTAASLALIWKRKLSPWKWMDLFAPVGALGYALGRVACLLTGCCFGAVCVLESGYQFRYPTQAFAIVWELGAMGLLLWLEQHRRAHAGLRNSSRSHVTTAWWEPPGQLFFVWMALHAVGRIVMELFRADDRGPGLFGTSLTIGMAISAGLLITALALTRRRAGAKT